MAWTFRHGRERTWWLKTFGNVPRRYLPVPGQAASRFTRYSGLSLVTIPAGYSLLLLARHFWHVNAGLLNLGVGMSLTLPSFLLYRRFVWHEGSGRSMAVYAFSFWQTVMIGALASSALIALADAWLRASGPEIVLAASPARASSSSPGSPGLT